MRTSSSFLALSADPRYLSLAILTAYSLPSSLARALRTVPKYPAPTSPSTENPCSKKEAALDPSYTLLMDCTGVPFRKDPSGLWVKVRARGSCGARKSGRRLKMRDTGGAVLAGGRGGGRRRGVRRSWKDIGSI